MQPPPNLLQAAPAAMRSLRRAQAAIAASAAGPFGTEAVTIVQAIGRVLAVQPADPAGLQRRPDDAPPLTVGTVLSPTHTALLASMRSSTINVFARARVGVTCLGSDTNDCRTSEAMLSGLVNRLGAKALSTRCPSPDLRMLPRTVEMLLVGCDVVLLCGRMADAQWSELTRSLGAYSVDTSAFKVPTLEPVRIAQHAGKLVVQFGDDLASAFATFVLLLSPLVRRLQGRDDPIPAATHFAASAPLDGGSGETLVLTRARHGGGHEAFPLLGNGSPDALLVALARATGIAWYAAAGEAGGAPRAATHFALDAWLA